MLATIVCRLLLVLAALALFVSLYFLLLWSSLMLCVLACEDVALVEIFKRAFVLTVHGLWRGCLFMGLLILTIILLQIASRLPLVIVGLIDMLGSGMPDFHAVASGRFQPSFFIEIIDLFWNSLVSVLVFAVGCTTYGIFYDDLRQRTEGADIIRKVEHLAQAQS
jgi:hypothetical protein